MTRTPTLQEVVGITAERAMGDAYVALPARVEEYDAARLLIQAKPLIKRSHYDEAGDLVVHPVGIVNDVPVVFPGAGGFRITFPIQVGDTVLLVFLDRSKDRWQDSDGATDVDPEDLRTHHVSDAIAIPGLLPIAKAWTGASTTDATLGKDGGPQVILKALEVLLGDALGTPATHPVIKSTMYRAAEDTLLAALGTLVAAIGAYATAIKPVADPTNAGTTTLGTAITTFGTALTTFTGAAPSYLSTVVKTS